VGLWIADRRGGEEKRRRRPVKARDAKQAAHDVGEVRAEYTAVGVQLVDDDILQIREQPRPRGVVRHDARMKHVRVGEQKSGPLPRGAARVDGGVAVIGDGANTELGVAHERA
jgi:hypothetical protein